MYKFGKKYGLPTTRDLREKSREKLLLNKIRGLENQPSFLFVGGKVFLLREWRKVLRSVILDVFL